MLSLPGADSTSWSRVIDLGHSRLTELDLSGLSAITPASVAPARNEQTQERFAAEAVKVREASPPLIWRRPSDYDADRIIVDVGAISDFNDTAEMTSVVGAGRLRGLILHKLMEEFLTGELAEDQQAALDRTRILLSQMASADDPALPDVAEMSAAALRTIKLPDVARLRPALVPELAVWSQDENSFVAGRADALAIEKDRVTTVLDWKSDVAPSTHERAQHAAQLTDYKAMLKADRAAVIYMTTGEVWWL